MKLDKVGKRISAVTTLAFSHVVALGAGAIIYTNVHNPPATADQMWALGVSIALTVFFGGLYFFTEEK